MSSKLVCILTVCLLSSQWCCGSSVNSTRSYREKRGLVFSNGGVVNAVFGFLVPIDTPKWQQVNCLNNLRAQYSVPVNWKQIYNIFNSRAAKPDSTRETTYKLLEHMINRQGSEGKSCVLRTICEVAETPFKHNGLLGELFQFFFTPGMYELLSDTYRDAEKAGKAGADCVSLYPKCPKGDGLLEKISVMV